MNHSLKLLAFNDLHETRIGSADTMIEFDEGIELKISDLRVQVEIRVSETSKFNLLLEGIKVALPDTYASVQAVAGVPWKIELSSKPQER